MRNIKKQKIGKRFNYKQTDQRMLLEIAKLVMELDGILSMESDEFYEILELYPKGNVKWG